MESPVRTEETLNVTQSYPHVGLVLLNWNEAHFTLPCLESLQALDYPSYEVVVVDNGSVDDSVPRIRERFPNVPLIENGVNLGFAGGNNVGITFLMDRGADYVLLLNNDTEVAPNFLRALVAVGESDAAIGVLGPKIYYYDHPDLIWCAGGVVDRFGRACHLGVDQPDDGGPEAPRDVDYATGCAILVKRQVIEEVGVLDDRFFIYFEEAEWCARARRAGYRVVYVPQGRIWHKIPLAGRGRSRRYLYLMARNRLLYLRCSGASPWILLRASSNVLRTAASWRLRSRHREMRPFAGALVRGVRDFALGRFGSPPPEL